VTAHAGRATAHASRATAHAGRATAHAGTVTLPACTVIALAWFVRGEATLPRAFDAAIRDPESTVVLSVVSAWDVTRCGSLPARGKPRTDGRGAPS
jgi:hypothetical protein